MKAIMLMFDSLNRHMLPPYGCDWVHAPNFQRLAARTVTFDKCYVASMPCMPARREIHTGRYNFLHRSWGPVEPFDDSMPQILRNNGIYTHLASDHYHYWEDGGATYHNRYNSWECFRGQEGDPWKGEVKDPYLPKFIGQARRQDQVNRQYITAEKDWPQTQTVSAGLEFIKTNRQSDNWFLHIETFDPHEPFYVPKKYQNLYPHSYKGPLFDWPHYRMVTETPEQVNHIRLLNAALVSMCDHSLGRVLDAMDRYGLWKDTLLIVNTDHGFLLGEHDWWAKIAQPFYEEVAHTPLFIWDPRSGKKNERRQSLVQTIDLAPTLLEYFGVARPKDMQGRPLRQTIARDMPVRQAGLFGIHGGHINCTDGRYVYMRAPVRASSTPLFEYTHIPTHMSKFFSCGELKDIRLQKPFKFTKGCRTMKIKAWPPYNAHRFGTLLFDLQTDPHQEHPLQDKKIEARMIKLMVGLMKANDAPLEQYKRVGIKQPR